MNRETRNMSNEFRLRRSSPLKLLSHKRLVIALCILGLTGCYQKMEDQPRFEPLEPTTFFEDFQSSRPVVAGTVPRGHLELDSHYYRGRVEGELVEELPMPVTRELLERGRERMEIFCSPCHDKLGTGRGMVVRRGFPAPPTWHSQRLRDAPAGHFFHVITNGYGRMPEYGTRIPPEDRWAIVAYIRALQLSQHARVSELAAEDLSRLKEAAE